MICNRFKSFLDFRKVWDQSIYYIVFFIILCLGFITANKYYQFYNFYYVEGIGLRIVQMMPLFFIVLIAYIKLIPNNLDEFPTLYWYFFIFMTIIPMIVVYIFNGIGESKNIIMFIYLVSFLCMVGALLLKIDILKIRNTNINKHIFWFGIIIILIAGYSYIIYKLGIPKNILKSFTDVYEIRLNYRKNSNRIVDYFVQWLGNAVNPFIFAYALRKKEYKKSFTLFILQLVLYIYTSYKSLFLVFFLAPLFGAVISIGLSKKFVSIMFILGAAVGTIAGFLDFLMIYLLSVLRIFLWPALIAFEYYDFFYMYPKPRLSYSSFVPFIPDVYNIEPPFLISKLYYNKPLMRANTTWYADAYANFGFIGVIVFAVILYLILIVIKAIQNKDKYLVSSCLFGGIITLFNGPLLTTIITGGLAVGIFLAYFIPNEICTSNQGLISLNLKLGFMLNNFKIKIINIMKKFLNRN
ncbi:oligosaccharide repeat unit polymerase [Clostridium sp. SYSU_GA19001]|uniref:O-antigen polymerase n=1 Tax=Clostridium caldaquaticum TaxID=2940653 RepID=UPI002076F31F|nr:O-antigen polymerase [Clostridium caldaquaticum]MCM8711285.1 oligosaccharide repeat unit polymerase [Clostridium caldaquaticum]